MTSGRDHLFISYATEDAVFARWLALRLTAAGYRVWIDQFELLGGERYPAEIDVAIKRRTFRSLALLSRSSIDKPNPTKERTLALNLATKRREDFVIPLNLDGLDPTELDWMSSDLTFIPFDTVWALGFRQLLERLEKLKAPSLATGAGPLAAREAVRSSLGATDQPEILRSNLFPILSWPDVIYQYRFTREVSTADVLQMAERWPFYFRPAAPHQRQLALAFEPPPGNAFGAARVIREAAAVWDSVREVAGIPIWHVLKPLTTRAVYHTCRSLGLKESPDGSYVYFPAGLLPDERHTFTTYTGRRVPLLVTGERSFRGTDRFRYNLGFYFNPLRLPGGLPCLKIGIKLRLTDIQGAELPAATAFARRKSVTRTWHHHQFISRTLGIASFLSDDNGKIRCGEEGQLVIQGTPLTVSSSVSIDEASLPKGRRPFRSRAMQESTRENV